MFKIVKIEVANKEGENNSREEKVLCFDISCILLKEEVS
jgi:hypothetical protein